MGFSRQTHEQLTKNGLPEQHAQFFVDVLRSQRKFAKKRQQANSAPAGYDALAAVDSEERLIFSKWFAFPPPALRRYEVAWLLVSVAFIGWLLVLTLESLFNVLALLWIQPNITVIWAHDYSFFANSVTALIMGVLSLLIIPILPYQLIKRFSNTFKTGHSILLTDKRIVTITGIPYTERRSAYHFWYRSLFRVEVVQCERTNLWTLQINDTDQLPFVSDHTTMTELRVQILNLCGTLLPPGTTVLGVARNYAEIRSLSRDVPQLNDKLKLLYSLLPFSSRVYCCMMTITTLLSLFIGPTNVMLALSTFPLIGLQGLGIAATVYSTCIFCLEKSIQVRIEREYESCGREAVTQSNELLHSLGLHAYVRNAERAIELVVLSIPELKLSKPALEI